ncbi:DUF3500 domain-containing protein [Nitrospira sp. M1]
MKTDILSAVLAACVLVIAVLLAEIPQSFGMSNDASALSSLSNSSKKPLEDVQLLSEAVRSEMVDIASEILKSVSEGSPFAGLLGVDHAEQMVLKFTDQNRENWQFWPTARAGLSLEYMSAEQRMLVHDLLTHTLSSAGYLKVVTIMQLEEILDVLDDVGLPRSVDHYVWVLFGTPSMESAWGWRFEGHHVSLNVTVSPDGLSVTPSFLGSNPGEVTSGPLAGLRVHGIQEDLARKLVMSLNDSQKKAAILSEQAPAEIFAANLRKPREQWNDWEESLEPQGISVASLDELQQFWIRRILDEAIANYRPEISLGITDTINLDVLRFAWMGSTERRKPHYFRLQGPDFVFEYDNVQNGNHVHAVWRSKSNDFGAGILEQHYKHNAH